MPLEGSHPSLLFLLIPAFMDGGASVESQRKGGGKRAVSDLSVGRESSQAFFPCWNMFQVSITDAQCQVLECHILKFGWIFWFGHRGPQNVAEVDPHLSLVVSPQNLVGEGACRLDGVVGAWWRIGG